MPERVGVDRAPDCRKVEKLEGHGGSGEADTERDEGGARRAIRSHFAASPRRSAFADKRGLGDLFVDARGKASEEREARGEGVREPDEVVRDPEEEVERYVVRVVEAREEGEVGDVCEVGKDAKGRPYAEPQERRGREKEETRDGKVEGGDDSEGGGEVVKFFCCWRVPGMKDGRPDPHVHAQHTPHQKH